MLEKQPYLFLCWIREFCCHGDTLISPYTVWWINCLCFMETEKSMLLFTVPAASVNYNMINVRIDWSNVRVSVFATILPLYACVGRSTWMVIGCTFFFRTVLASKFKKNVSNNLCDHMILCICFLFWCVFSVLKQGQFCIDNLLVPVIQTAWVERPFSFSPATCP